MEKQEKALKWRERVIDTPEGRVTEENRVKPLTENVDFYTRAGTYKYGLRHLEKEPRIMVGELEPLVKDDKWLFGFFSQPKKRGICLSF